MLGGSWDEFLRTLDGVLERSVLIDGSGHRERCVYSSGLADGQVLCVCGLHGAGRGEAGGLPERQVRRALCVCVFIVTDAVAPPSEEGAEAGTVGASVFVCVCVVSVIVCVRCAHISQRHSLCGRLC